MTTGVTNITKKFYGELVVYHKNKYIFLGMDTELVKDGDINIGMKSYIKEAIKTLGEDVSIGVA